MVNEASQKVVAFTSCFNAKQLLIYSDLPLHHLASERKLFPRLHESSVLHYLQHFISLHGSYILVPPLLLKTLLFKENLELEFFPFVEKKPELWAKPQKVFSTLWGLTAGKGAYSLLYIYCCLRPNLFALYICVQAQFNERKKEGKCARVRRREKESVREWEVVSRDITLKELKIPLETEAFSASDGTETNKQTGLSKLKGKCSNG